MAKVPSSVIGVDLGRFALKSVVLLRKGGNRFAVTHYASHPLSEPIEDADHLARELKVLLKEMGGSAKVCAVSVSSPDALIRIIDQPQTPTEILRSALRLNGMTLLNQDCKEFVLDCDEIVSSEPPTPREPGTSVTKKYLVGGIPRTQIGRVTAGFEKSGQPVTALQLAPVCLFNAFEFAQPEVFATQPFFLVDIGHTSTTMLIGMKRELVLVRQIDIGGRMILDTLMALSGESRDSVIMALHQEDEVMVENTRMALTVLAREIGSSIGFFEGRREETISKIWISGGSSKSKTIVKVLAEELHMPCVVWNAVEKCENAIATNRRDAFAAVATDLNVACGAAAELLTA